MKPNLNITVRVEKKTGNILLCYRNGRVTDGKVVIDRGLVGYYNTNERCHGDMATDYYYDNTKPCKDKVMAQKLFEAYTSDWEDLSVPRLRQKLE